MLVPAHKWSSQPFFWLRSLLWLRVLLQHEDFGLLGLGFLTNTEKLEESCSWDPFPLQRRRAHKVVLSLPPNLFVEILLRPYIRKDSIYAILSITYVHLTGNSKSKILSNHFCCVPDRQLSLRGSPGFGLMLVSCSETKGELSLFSSESPREGELPGSVGYPCTVRWAVSPFCSQGLGFRLATFSKQQCMHCPLSWSQLIGFLWNKSCECFWGQAGCTGFSSFHATQSFSTVMADGALPSLNCLTSCSRSCNLPCTALKASPALVGMHEISDFKLRKCAEPNHFAHQGRSSGKCGSPGENRSARPSLQLSRGQQGHGPTAPSSSAQDPATGANAFVCICVITSAAGICSMMVSTLGVALQWRWSNCTPLLRVGWPLPKPGAGTSCCCSLRTYSGAILLIIQRPEPALGKASQAEMPAQVIEQDPREGC